MLDRYEDKRNSSNIVDANAILHARTFEFNF